MVACKLNLFYDSARFPADGIWDGSPEVNRVELVFLLFLLAEVLSPNICLNSVILAWFPQSSGWKSCFLQSLVE